MAAPRDQYSIELYEMMTCLGIDPGAGGLPQLRSRYEAALHRCESCRCKTACRNWLDFAPPMVNFAPDFCANADILFDLQRDQAAPRIRN